MKWINYISADGSMLVNLDCVLCVNISVEDDLIFLEMLSTSQPIRLQITQIGRANPMGLNPTTEDEADCYYRELKDFLSCANPILDVYNS